MKHFILWISIALSCLFPKTSVASDQFVSLDVTNNQVGDLARLLGDKKYQVDSLVVRGCINDADINTLWDATYNGHLSVINLQYAKVENATIPRFAFFHTEQILPAGNVQCTHLRKIILPDGIKHIGKMAFAYANLKEIEFPSSLKSLDDHAFTDCANLSPAQLVFPEGFERFGQLVFCNCRKLTAQVILPSTIKEIGDGAFFSSKITAINLPEGLERIGDAAFYACRLKEVTIPSSCLKIDGSSSFALNFTLEKITLPEGLEEIPSSFCYNCNSLKETYIPSTVKTIKNSAFEGCESLKKLDLPEGLETIDYWALSGCESLEEITFPKSLKKLGYRSCQYWDSIKRIYCLATEPPYCNRSMGNDTDTPPFGSYKTDIHDGTPKDTRVYVPLGSAEKYRQTKGWDYFVNYIETNDFPTAIHQVTENVTSAQHGIYDLNGRKVINPQKGHIYIKNGKKIINL